MLETFRYYDCKHCELLGYILGIFLIMTSIFSDCMELLAEYCKQLHGQNTALIGPCCWDKNIPRELNQYCGYWYPGSLYCQVISNHDIDHMINVPASSMWTDFNFQGHQFWEITENKCFLIPGANSARQEYKSTYTARKWMGTYSSTVATDGLVLKHQTISTHSGDQISHCIWPYTWKIISFWVNNIRKSNHILK